MPQAANVRVVGAFAERADEKVERSRATKRGISGAVANRLWTESRLSSDLAK